jgi:hypothetical protein
VPHPNSVSFYRYCCHAALLSLSLLLATVLTDSVIYICCDMTGWFLFICCIVFCTLWPKFYHYIDVTSWWGAFPPKNMMRIRVESDNYRSVWNPRLFTLLHTLLGVAPLDNCFSDWAVFPWVFHGITITAACEWAPINTETPMYAEYTPRGPNKPVQRNKNNRLNRNAVHVDIYCARATSDHAWVVFVFTCVWVSFSPFRNKCSHK